MPRKKTDEEIRSCRKIWEDLDNLIQRDGAPVKRDICAWIDALDWVLGENRHEEPTQNAEEGAPRA